MRLFLMLAVALLWCGAVAQAGPTYYFHPDGPAYPQAPFATITFPDVVNGNAISATAPWSISTTLGGINDIKAHIYFGNVDDAFFPVGFDRVQSANFAADVGSSSGARIDSGALFFYTVRDPSYEGFQAAFGPTASPTSSLILYLVRGPVGFQLETPGTWTTATLPIPVPPVPAPASLLLLSLGFAGVLVLARLRRA